MSTYQDFLNVVSGLNSGTVFAITTKWCTAHGLIVTPNMMKSWGIKFRSNYSKYGCSNYTVSPTQGTARSKSSNNLRHYKKN